MEDYQDRMSIATPEGLTVELVLGGLGSRFTAAVVDLTIKIVLLVGLLLLVEAAGSDYGVAFGSIVSLVIYIGYDIAFESLARGRTPGKRLAGLRVLRADGRPVDVLSSSIRNIVRLVDGVTLAYLPGMISILVTRRNQRLGDLAGGTIVVREERAEDAPAPTFDTPGTPGTPARAWQPPGVPGAVPAGPAGVILDLTAVTGQDVVGLRAFVDRRAQLDPALRTDLAARLAGAVRPRVGGATDGLSDEQLIEQIVRAKGG